MVRAGWELATLEGALAALAAPDLVNLASRIDDAKCFARVRQQRWPEGVRCPGRGCSAVVRHGGDDTRPHRQRYRCKACAGRFDDLTGTVLAGHHQPLRVWVRRLYLMGLTLSNRQIAGELGLSGADVQPMAEQLRHGLLATIPAATLEGEVEIDEVHVVAGHRRRRAPGPTGRGGEKGRLGRRRLAGAPGRGTLEKDQPPVLGLIRRGGQVVLHMLANVRQKAIQPIIAATVATGTLIHTDEYDIYARLGIWGYRHEAVCHGRGEYARDEDGDGVCEVHVNTLEGFWSLLRSWLRPHRGISQEKLPLYRGFFQFVHNARRRGKALLGELVAALVA
jgi:transposase-like protein